MYYMVNFGLFKIKCLFRERIKDDYEKNGIYSIVNLTNGKQYIGQTRNGLATRLLQHQGDLYKRRDNKHLVNAFHKYGADNFACYILEYAPENITLKELIKWLNKAEVKWIRYFRNILGDEMVYNQNDGGDGINPTKEYRENLSRALKKTYKSPALREQARRITTERYKNPKEREKTSISLKKAYENPELRKQNSEVQKKRFKDPKEREKMSAAMTVAHKEHPEYGERKSASQKKRFEKQEEHDKMSAIVSKRYEDPEEHIKTSVTTKEAFKDPAKRKKLSDRNIRRYARLGEREKESERQKKSYREKPERKEKQSKSHLEFYKNEDNYLKFKTWHKQSNATNKERNERKQMHLSYILIPFLYWYPHFSRTSKNHKLTIIATILKECNKRNVHEVTYKTIQSFVKIIYKQVKKKRN